MTTKERIIVKALELFAAKGYDGVSVRDIAQEVGVRESALYKHYKSKQAIFDTIIEMASTRTEQIYKKLAVPAHTSKEVAQMYQEISIEQLVEISCKLFRFYLSDEIVAPYRRILTIEQYRNSELQKRYTGQFIDHTLEVYSKLFRSFIENGMFKEVDADVLALHFYGPIYLLFQKYDLDREHLEEGEQLIKNHVEQFARNYDKRVEA
ncbi:MAG: TetR/AcrR family transcriptional regulator [Cellulosilyticum sp.]|nr:TetR/AcrR family transcriptional regulator [Cellulosilyticum sp.]